MGEGAVPLFLPAGETSRGFVSALGHYVDIDVRGTTSTDRTFFDTFDGRLHRKSLRMTVDGSCVAISDTNGQELEREAGAKTLTEGTFVRDLPHGQLVDRLARVVEDRALQPIARVRGTTREYGVRNSDRKMVARIVVDDAVAVGPGRRTIPLRSRVVLHEVRGYAGAFARTERTLVTDLALVP